MGIGARNFGLRGYAFQPFSFSVFPKKPKTQNPPPRPRRPPAMLTPPLQPFNPSTLPPFNPSTLQPFNASTLQPFNPSTEFA
jgi:hypothetical protein